MSVKYPGLVVAVAILISLPMASPLLSGEISATTAAIRFLIDLLACWIFGSALTWVFSTYSDQVRRAEAIKAIEEARQSEHQEMTG